MLRLLLDTFSSCMAITSESVDRTKKYKGG